MKLCTHALFDNADFMFRSTFAKLRPLAANRLSSEPVTVGGILQNHFLETGSDISLVWKLSPSDYRQVEAHDFTFPLPLEVQSKHILGLGILPEAVDELPNMAALWEQAADSAGLDVVCFPDPQLGTAAGPPPDSAHLGLIADLSHEVAGAVSHRFDPEALISCLGFARRLRPPIVFAGGPR